MNTTIKRFKPFFVLIIIVLVSVLSIWSIYVSQAKVRCKHLGDMVVIKGTIFRELYYGPPNYGEFPSSDAKEFVRILYLDKPLEYIGANGLLSHIDQIQLVGYEDTLANGRATISGCLDDGVSGHHRRDVIIVHPTPSKGFMSWCRHLE